MRGYGELRYFPSGWRIPAILAKMISKKFVKKFGVAIDIQNVTANILKSVHIFYKTKIS